MTRGDVSFLASLRAPPVTDDDPVYLGRVVMHLDTTTRAVFALASWWVLFRVVVVYGFCSLFSTLFLRRAAALLVASTALRVGIDEFYVTMLSLHGPELRRVVEVVSDPKNHPVVVTCSLGKDRTGIAVALVLSAAGVSDTDVAADYALSVDGEDLLGQLGLNADWHVAKEATMLKMLEHLRGKHGSVDGYLKFIGVSEDTLANLRTSLTVKPQ